MISMITDMRNIINTKFKCQKIIFDIEVNLNASPGFADFTPSLLNSDSKLNSWYNNIINKGIIKNNFRSKLIENNFKNEIEEINQLKKGLSKNSYYNNQIKLAKPFLIKHSLTEDDLKEDFIDKKLSIINQNKIDLINEMKKNNLDKKKILLNIEPILKEIEQLKACKKICKLKKDTNIVQNIDKKIKFKKYLLLKKINNLNIYTGSENGISFERLSFDILKNFAKQMGPDYYVGEILSNNNVWKINERKRKGMKQDIDGFIFKIEDGIIKVVEIYEFKSTHLAIIDDIIKLEKLLDYLLKFNYDINFIKCNDDIYRPHNEKTSLILNCKSFCSNKFKLNRYQNIKYLFKLNKETKSVQFNYLTISQFNKTKNIKDIKIKRKKLVNFIKKNNECIFKINNISNNGGLIGVLIDNN
jgi:hypothetical protein